MHYHTTETLKKKKTYLEIDQKYADDITLATTAKQRITYSIKETTPSTLAKRYLVINESKTEEYEIIRQGKEKWKKCKLLGSLPDMEKDTHRQILAIDAFKTLNTIFDSRKISNSVKIRTFNVYVASVFLYNSELWILTKSWKI